MHNGSLRLTTRSVVIFRGGLMTYNHPAANMPMVNGLFILYLLSLCVVNEVQWTIKYEFDV